MPTANLILHIRDTLEQLRPAERKVGEAVLADVDFAMHASIAELALKAQVSEPSVTRFCRAIGCEGLRAFKVQLAHSVASGLPYNSETVEASDDTHTLIHKVCDAISHAFQHSRDLIDPLATEAAIRALALAPRIYFFGVGAGSGIVAEDAYLRFLRLDIAASAFTDGHLQRLSAGLLEPGDVAFAISHTGRSQEVIDSLKIAKQRGATTIALTTAGSPLAWVADIPLLVRLPRYGDPHTPGVSRLVHLGIMDILAIGTALRRGPRSIEKVRRARARLETLRASDDTDLSDPTGAF